MMTSSKISRMPCLSQISRRRLQIALRRRQHAGRTRHRLDDDGGDGRGVVQRDQPVEFVGEMRAPLRLADREGLLGAVIGGRQMIDAGEQRAELLAVGDHAADRDAAEADAVIAALAADQPHARGVAAHVVIGERDLQRGVDRLRAGIAEEHMVEIAGRQRGDRGSQVRRPWDGRTGRSARNPSPPPASGSPRRSARGYGRHWCTTGRPSRRGSCGRPA